LAAEKPIVNTTRFAVPRVEMAVVQLLVENVFQTSVAMVVVAEFVLS
jgi:hypothetical protein